MGRAGPPITQMDLSLRIGSWFRIKSVLDCKHLVWISQFSPFNYLISQREKAISLQFYTNHVSFMTSNPGTLLFYHFCPVTLASLGSLHILFPLVGMLFTKITPEPTSSLAWIHYLDVTFSDIFHSVNIAPYSLYPFTHFSIFWCPYCLSCFDVLNVSLIYLICLLLHLSVTMCVCV